MRVSIGTSRMDKHWKQADLTWPQFIEIARKHRTTGTETHAEYMALPKAKQDALKDNGGFVAAALAGGHRKRGCCTERSMVTLDIDNAPAGATEALCAAVASLGCDYLIYSTRKHDPEHPRLRVIIPIDRPVTADEYQPLARAAAQTIDPSMVVFDPTTFEAERLMYWPSASSDSQAVFQSNLDARALPADALLSTYEDWRNAAEWPLCPAESEPKRPGGKQADPTQKTGLVDYNKYTITNILQREVELPTINGLIVVVNDRGTSHVDSGNTIYDCYLFGQGCFLEATPTVTTPDYSDYNPELGGGTDILYNNRSWILHPNGVSFLADNIAGETPTDAEFTNKANWALRFQHQNVRIGKIEIQADKLTG